MGTTTATVAITRGSGPRSTRHAPPNQPPAQRRSDRLAVGLQELLLREGHELERRLGARFWRSPVKGDLVEALGKLPPPAGELTAFARVVTLEGLWACIKEDPQPATLRRYFAWAAQERARALAVAAMRASGDVGRTHSETPPGNLLRLPGGVTIWRAYVAAVRLEFRRQQAAFDMWARATGLLTHVDHGVTNHDELAGWNPHFDAKGLLPHQRDAYRAAGQHALDILRAEDFRRKARRDGGLVVGGDFSIDDPKLQERVDALLLDRIVGIDETTSEILRAILASDGTIVEKAEAIDETWDEASTVRGITIASTEMARASAAAELDTYRENDVAQVEVDGGYSGDICDEYVGERFDVDSDEAVSLIPIHPRCTHYWSPVIPDDWHLPTTPWAGGDLEEPA